MTTKKALIIGLLSIALTGITACAISYTKKTGNSLFKTQATQTNATYNFNTVNITSTAEQYTISGNSTITNPSRETTPTLSQINYTFVKDGNELSTYITVTKLYYLDELDHVQKNILAGVTIDQHFVDITKEINTITIAQQGITILNGNRVFRCYYTIDLNYTDDTKTRYQMYSTGESVNTIFCDDPNPNILIETIDVKPTIDAFKQNYDTAYATGYNDADSFGEVIDIRGLMLNIITMPFTFISQAFDVVLWEGTQYEFHLAGFIKGMIAIAVILFIIRLFTSGFAVLGNYSSSKNDRKLTKAKIEKTKAETRKINRK